MKVFISWSGDTSKTIAELFHEWLKNVIQAVQPWMSSSDIEKGSRWPLDLATELDGASFGLICLTSENLEDPWILFEAGALSKTLGKSLVCPYLFHLQPVDVTGPLSHFQATKAEKEDTKKLIHTINRALGDTALSEHQINRAFDLWWPDFEQKLSTIQPPGAKPAPREVREILEEVLELVRSQSRDSSLIEANRSALSSVKRWLDYQVSKEASLIAEQINASASVLTQRQVPGIGKKTRKPREK